MLNSRRITKDKLDHMQNGRMKTTVWYAFYGDCEDKCSLESVYSGNKV